MGASFTYTFHDVECCNMCGSGREMHQILGKRLNGSQGKSPHKRTGITTTIMRCKRCGLVFSNPMPLPRNIHDHYGISPEKYWTKEYLNTEVSVYRPVIEAVKKELTDSGTLRSLDIGAGLGKMMRACADAGFDAWGCEASEPFYQQALEKMGLSPEQLKLGCVEEIDFPESFFDYINIDAVLEHTTDPSAVLKRCMKWLRPDGIVVVAGPSSNWMISKWIDRYYSLRGLGYTSHISPMHPPYHLFEFGLKSFEYNGKENGYIIHKHHYNVCETFLPKRFDGLLKGLMKRNSTGMDLTVYLKKAPVQS